MTKKKYDLKKESPTSKSQLTKENMLDFMRDKSKEEREWFVNLVKSHTKEKKNNLTGKMIEGYDLPKIRTQFAEKYFPELNQKKMVSSKKRFEDELNSLLD